MASSGVTNVCIVSSKDTTHLDLSPVQRLQVSTEQWPLQKENPTHHIFHILMVPDFDNPKIEKKFVISFPPKYTGLGVWGDARCYKNVCLIETTLCILSLANTDPSSPPRSPLYSREPWTYWSRKMRLSIATKMVTLTHHIARRELSHNNTVD